MTSMIPQSLVALADIRPRAIDDWAQYRLEGEQFLRLAEQAHHRQKKAFTPTILYNLVTMAIEKLVMAALMRCGRLPDNHTLHVLVAARDRWLPETVRGLDIQITATGCLKQCENGPILVVQPDNWWYRGVNSTAILDSILDAIEEGEPARDHLIE